MIKTFNLKVLKDDGSNKYYSFLDFNIGNVVIIYKRALKIYDCDEFTRKFY